VLFFADYHEQQITVGEDVVVTDQFVLIFVVLNQMLVQRIVSFEQFVTERGMILRDCDDPMEKVKMWES